MDTATTEIYTLSLHDALPIFTATAGGFLSASVTVNVAPAPRLDVTPPAVLLEIRSEEHTSELQSLRHLVCRLLLEKKKNGNVEKRIRSTASNDHHGVVRIDSG